MPREIVVFCLCMPYTPQPTDANANFQDIATPNIPDIPRGSELGRYFREYIINKFIGRSGYSAFQHSIAEESDDTVKNNIRFEYISTGKMLLKGVLNTHSVYVLPAEDGINIRTQVAGDDVVVERRRGNVFEDGTVVFQTLQI